MLNYIKDSNNMDEIVFEKRNRSYGAYTLRKQYPETMNKAFFYTLSGMLVLGIVAVLAGRVLGNSIKHIESGYEIPITLCNLTPPEPIEKIYEVPKAKVVLPKVSQTATATPSPSQSLTTMQVVTDIENKPTTDAKPIADLLPDVAIGNQTIDGPPGITSTPFSTTQGNESNSLSTSTEKAEDFVEEMPEFIGGENALYSFIQNNFEYPSLLRDADITGKVVVSFVVEKDGSISNVNILRGIHPSLDKESKRVISMLPKFKPGYQNKMPVRVRYNIPIKVELN